MKEISNMIDQTKPLDTFTNSELEITDLPALELQKLILNQKITLQEAYNRFCYKRSKIGNDKEIFTQIIDAQAQINDLNSRDPKQLPLLGFVMTVKDSIRMQNTKQTCGLYINNDKINTKPTPFITYLQSKGAIIISKGNVPQSLMAMESNNHIYGRSKHYKDNNRTSGGSTGGDAVILALGLANCALGSDGAGSLRIPAFYNGLYTLKTSWQRSVRNVNSSFYELQEYFGDRDEFLYIFKGVAGAITRNIDDLYHFSKIMFEFY